MSCLPATAIFAARGAAIPLLAAAPTMSSISALIAPQHHKPGPKNNVASANRSPRKLKVVRLFGGAGPTAVLVDLRLGQDDGLDLLLAIRARSDVPMIMMTDTSVPSLIALSDWSWPRTITSQSRSVLANSLIQCQTESAYAVPKPLNSSPPAPRTIGLPAGVARRGRQDAQARSSPMSPASASFGGNSGLSGKVRARGNYRPSQLDSFGRR